MLTAEGCKARRRRLLERLKPAGPLVLGDPLNLRYLAGFYVDPFSLGADFGGVLVLTPDGHATLYYDARTPKSWEPAHADEKVAVKWYDGVSPGNGPRRTILRPIVEQHGGRVHDSLGDEMSGRLHAAVGELRRAKDDDEIALIGTCCRAGEAGMAWARANVAAGMTELDVYEGIFKAVADQAGQPTILYGDFAVSPGMGRKGGPPTRQVLKDGDMMILDFSAIIGGYRSDFTNTLVVGKKPTADQQRLYDLCVAAMAAGERHLRAGVHGKEVYNAVRESFREGGMEAAFPHHAGHGLGLSHPEAPFLVKQSLEALVAGDVVTLEPGLYVDGVGGIRVEHNYLVTETGCERISRHEITLV